MSHRKRDDVVKIQLSKQFEGRARKYRREEGICYEILATLRNRYGFSTYMVGSLIEGTHILDSDLDGLYSNDNLAVVNNLNDHPTNTRLVFIMVNCKTSPGYVKLHLAIYGKPLTNICPEKLIKYTSLDSDGRVVLSELRTGCPQMSTKNGPAIRSPTMPFLGGTMPHDFVPAVRCRSWPEIAYEWILRKRTHAWPPKDIIERFQSIGCFLVHVGSPESKEIDLEWRISFSLQERELIFGLNEIQHECYLILKWIKKNFLNNVHGKPISSYHCKTCLFYMIERNSPDVWIQNKLIDCVIGCLKIVKACVLRRNCPNYFVATENMFAKIHDEKEWTIVAEKLRKLINNDVKIEIDFEKYQFKNFFKHLISPSFKHLQSIIDAQISQLFGILYYNFHILQSILEIDKKADYFNYNKKEYILETIHTLKQQIHLLLNKETITEHTTGEYKTAIGHLLPFLYISFGGHLAAYSLQCENLSEKEEFKRLAEANLNVGVTSDSTSGRLKKISFMYSYGQYEECLKELSSLQQINWSYSIILCCAPPFQTKHRYDEYMCSLLETKDYSTKEFFQSFCSACVLFAPTEVDLLPFALQIEVFRIVILEHSSQLFCDYVLIESRMYTLFLLYLISKKMNKARKERVSIIDNMENILPLLHHRSLAWNLIAWTLAEEGFIQVSLLYLFLSWKHKVIKEDTIIKTYLTKNARRSRQGQSTIWHILILLWRIMFTDYISCIETSYQLSFCFQCSNQYTSRNNAEMWRM